MTRSVRDRTWKLLMLVILCVLSISFLFPIIWSLTASVKSIAEVYEYPPSLWVQNPQWSNYTNALSRLPFFRFMGNTLILCIASTIGQVLTASLVGYAFARLRWRGREIWFVILLATIMLPGQILLIPHYLIYQSLGWVNTYKPLIIPSWLGGGAFFIFFNKI